ncbi:MAG TPA: hypothetical protein VFQ18_09125 [Candidatus Acidoferrum sp.]|nr:hypothetical protein [Candidatus Acidoferrum sp.]
METTNPTQSGNFDRAPSGGFRASLVEAARFWEPRRLIYNAVLLAIVIAWVVLTWPHFRPALKLESLLIMSVLALLANVCYCTAYLVDLGLQPAEQEKWRSALAGVDGSAALRKRRWGLWAAGMLLAVLFENYWIADEIYPYVQ